MREPNTISRSSAPAIGILLILLTAGCEEAVAPVLQGNRPFSLYGYLDPGADQQAIRVFPIDQLLQHNDPVPLAATVQITGPTGSALLRDSVVTFWDETFGHVYHGAFSPAFGNTYVVRAEEPGGRSTTVSVRIPQRASLTTGDVEGVLGNVYFPVEFSDAEQILRPRVLYSIESTRAPFKWTIPVVYSNYIVRSENRWSILVNLSRDIGVIFSVTGLVPGRDKVTLTNLSVEAFITTSEWTPPGGEFDSELLVQPGTFSNVENGFGFVGGGYFETAHTLPPAEKLRLAGFANQ
jgi:hypothetical protein